MCRQSRWKIIFSFELADLQPEFEAKQGTEGAEQLPVPEAEQADVE